MDKNQSSRWAWVALLVGAPVLITAFQNCGQMFEDPVVKFDDVVLSSTGRLQIAPGCETQIISKYETLYRNTYFPLLTNSCAACHSGEGPGVGAFGYNDAMISGANFISRFTKINQNARAPAHANGYTGTPALVAAVNAAEPQWNAAISEYASCAGLVVAGNGIVSTGKANATIIANANANNANFVTLSWNLMTEIMNQSARNLIPVTFSIEARVAVIGGVRRGYEFRNPRVAINQGATGNFRFTTIKVYVNSAYMPDVTTYISVDGTVNSQTAVNLGPGYSNALAVTTALPVAADTFAFEFGYIRDANGVVINPGTGAPPPPPDGLPTSVTLAQLLGNDPALNVFAASCVGCHNAGNPRGGLDITNTAAARLNATDIYNRMNNAGNPMPPGALLSFNRRELVRIWVQGGAL